MPGPGDIPIFSGRGGRGDAESVELMWVVDGQDQPFRDARETQRPWLEDSADWVEGATPANEPGPCDDEGLVWL
ncbi:hypothetical protein [Paratractidigestivibacter sp.]|uniref:hypothetical protein n=1 Tax=Paratractidigestivibacter sp. TaxID=2847316 RepID=UPI002ABD299C|nr:hypothetical protein [Paratractidigestivibacter sp.]